FVHLNPLVIYLERFFLYRLPFGKIFHCNQSALFLAAPYKFLCYITFIKTIIGSIDGLFSFLSFFQRLLLGIYHLLQCLQKIVLPKDLPGFWRFPLLTG